MSNKPLRCQLNTTPPEAHNSWHCYSAVFLHCLTNYTKVTFVMKSEMYLAYYSGLQCSDEAWWFWTCQFSEPKMPCRTLPESLATGQNTKDLSFWTILQNHSTSLAQHWNMLLPCYKTPTNQKYKDSKISVLLHSPFSWGGGGGGKLQTSEFFEVKD